MPHTNVTVLLHSTPEDGTWLQKHVGNCYLSQTVFYYQHLLVDVMIEEMRNDTTAQLGGRLLYLRFLDHTVVHT